MVASEVDRMTNPWVYPKMTGEGFVLMVLSAQGQRSECTTTERNKETKPTLNDTFYFAYFTISVSAQQGDNSVFVLQSLL